jgi:hypothetical protein
MDSDKKKKFNRGSSLMPSRGMRLVRRDTTPYGAKKKVTKGKEGIIDINNLHMNMSIMSKTVLDSRKSEDSNLFPIKQGYASKKKAS